MSKDNTVTVTDNTNDIAPVRAVKNGAAPKPFQWSYSRYKAYDSCPRKHYECDLAKNFVDQSDQMRWGDEVHKALEAATLGDAPLPDSMRDYQYLVDEIRSGEGSLYIEQKFALTRDFRPVEFFHPDVWFRGICDVLRIGASGHVALARDYKTGKIQHDSRQLMLMATCIFMHHPKVKRIRTEFIWLKEKCVTTETFQRGSIFNEWPPLMPLVKQMERAHKTQDYPPKPCGLCARYCPVVSCAYHGKRYRAA
jgi:hypothetical protein